MSRLRPKASKSDGAGPSVSGQQLLGALADLRNGLRQWMLASLPTDSRLTVPRATLLLGLSLKRDPAGMSDLGASLGMSPRNMTVLVDGLAKEGLVRRVSHPRDRRITLVELTPAGRQVAEQELGPSQSAAGALFDDFTPKERSELLRLLEKVADSLRARGMEVPDRERS